MFIFGAGYTGRRLADTLRSRGWVVEASGGNGTLAFDDRRGVEAALARASHVLSTVPPDGGDDPVLRRFGPHLAHAWLGYLSSTGVYGDHQGAWVDEHTPPAGAGNATRLRCEAGWRRRGARVFRLAAIYGPGRSALDRVREGRAQRIALPGQVFSRVHVDDIVAALLAAVTRDAPAGVFNIADDEPASAARVVEHACRLLGAPLPPLLTPDEARLGEAARAFYAASRRVASGKARRLLGWTPRYPTFREGLAALLSETETGTDFARRAMPIPSSASSPPATDSADQR